ncbi:helix-turn-helix domain-containing protein [Butyricicoccus pullicaecorum]|uniref:HTH cro/C1-type domain-containing protein n=1 Tax=Butyricicoccus pullicaecorum 1.2 TaxID=1203606 RepID=R8VWP9_9FIRM|nr:helix-turn-helix transcriptional regulator [Butyricicoccus pullicaecorum]EOQ37165.1 hypothetical protein HMPREF1526_01856 [Butyricicoccus pullicaecorum 1.2]SKA58487.1 Transcriptional regulator, contains XRE-family HTH domain [Butyricicoccus pullicaecorum DSM 23266]
MENRKIGAFIAERRKESGLTQQALADRLGLTNKAVSKWETGDGLPDITILPALAENLGVTVDELLAGERRPKTPEVGEQTRKYLEERKRKQYKIAVMASALIVVLAVSYMMQSTYYFWIRPNYLLPMALSIGGYIAANIWIPGQETLRQRTLFCALWSATLFVFPAQWCIRLVDKILEHLQLADYLAERYVQEHDLTVRQTYWDFFQYYEGEIAQWTAKHEWIFWLAGIAIMIGLGLLVGHITWKLQHRERKKHESES